MLKHLKIRNFKVLAAVPPGKDDFIEFGPTNVFIGPNGCGKSSLLQAVDFLRAFFRTSVELYLQERGWDYRDLPNLRQTTKTIQWDLVGELGPDENGLGGGRYRYVVSLQPKRHLGVGQEQLVYEPEEGTLLRLLARRGRQCFLRNRCTEKLDELRAIGLPASLMSRLDPASADDRARYPELLRFRKWVEGFRAYLIWDPKILRNPDRGKHDEIGPSGEHLASVLGRLRDRDKPAFAKLIRRLRRLFPTLTDISVSGKGWGWRTVRLQEAKGNGDKAVFNSQQMSDGVLRLLAVTSLLYAEQPPTVLTFEEPENGVHPQLLREVVQILRELTQRRSPHPCQVFLTTHSPYVLDEFLDHPEQVYCMERAQPGAGASVLRLSEKGQLKTARNAFQKSLGEAWFSGLIGATAR